MVGNNLNTFQLINELVTWGHNIKPEQFHRYLSDMLRRNRVMTVSSEEGLEAIIFYFLTNELDSFINKPTWKIPTDSDRGHIFFIDKMLCRKWTKSLRISVQKQVEEKFPHITQALWLRRPNNRHVIIKRRGKHVYSQVSGQ